jgi:hypothetical protein
MKRYLLFTYDSYYPGGGWTDFAGSFDTIEEARAASPEAENRDIIDTTTWACSEEEL